MKRKTTLSALLPLSAIFLGTAAYSQVGINNTSPQATLDITATTTAAPDTKPDALLVPRMTLAQLAAKDTAYGSPQNGALVFVTDASTSTTTKTTNVTAIGFYYYDGPNSVWVAVGSGGGGGGSTPTGDFWAQQGNTYANGSTPAIPIVGLLNASAVKNLSVQGDVVTVNPASTATGKVTSFQVNGASTNTGAYSTTGTTIDFTQSNLAYTTASAGVFTITGMKDGGTYTLAVQGTTAGTSGFSQTSPVTLTFKPANNGPTSGQTVYTFIVMGSTAYYWMTTGM